MPHACPHPNATNGDAPMRRTLSALLLTAVALTVAACGGASGTASDSHITPAAAEAGVERASGTDAGGAGGGAGDTASDSHISPAAAKAGVERAARVHLVAQSIPRDAAAQGLRASYTNAATVAKDRQAIALFVLDDPRAAAKVKERVGSPVGGRLIAHDEVLVVYAPAGRNRGDQVEKAVEAL
jgi:hypothetical protein